MLHHRSVKRFMLISLALTGMAVSSVNAMSLNIDFGSLYSIPDTTVYGAASGQGGHWNQISRAGTTDLLNLSSEATAIELELISASSLPGDNINLGGNSGTPVDSGGFLLNDFFYTDNDKPEWSIKISNLDQGEYDIYYYAPPNSTVGTGDFSISTEESQSDPLSVDGLPGNSNSPATLIEHSSWDVIRGVSIGSFGLLLEFLPGDEFSHYGLSGLQLVQLPSAPISPVPVPAAVWLFGTALLGMIGFGKRRKAA